MPASTRETPLDSHPFNQANHLRDSCTFGYQELVTFHEKPMKNLKEMQSTHFGSNQPINRGITPAGDHLKKSRVVTSNEQMRQVTDRKMNEFKEKARQKAQLKKVMDGMNINSRFAESVEDASATNNIQV